MKLGPRGSRARTPRRQCVSRCLRARRHNNNNNDNNAGQITCRQTEPSHCTLYHKHTLTHLQLFTFSPTLHINDFHLTQKILLEPFGSSPAGPKCTNTPFYFHSGALNITQDSKSTMIFYPHICCSLLFVVFCFFGGGGFCCYFTIGVSSPTPPFQWSARPHRGCRCSSRCSAERQGTATVRPAWSQRRLCSISQALLTTIWMEDNLFLNC